jgi:hypothetical protein
VGDPFLQRFSELFWNHAKSLQPRNTRKTRTKGNHNSSVSLPALLAGMKEVA